MKTASRYNVEQFMSDARRILADDAPLPGVKEALGARLEHLSKRDDLTRYGAQIGPSDAANGTYLLWREPPQFTLLMVQFDAGWMSPVHEHGASWIVGCGYRGADRWDMYERLDAGTAEGEARLELVDQILVTPGKSISMPEPPRAIHSHNNVHDGDTFELIFSASIPLSADERLLYQVEEETCHPSWFEVSNQLSGDYFPPRVRRSS